MTESFQSPHFYLTVEVDTQELEKIRQQLIPLVESKVGVRLTFTDLLIKIVARSLEDNPDLNCAYADGSVRIFQRIDIGVVTSVEGGLVVPVIRQANKKPLAEVSTARAELTQKARGRKLSREEMTDSTFTISNLGMFGIDQFSAILQPQEAAILAVGRITEKPVVREGQLVIRPTMTLTLSIDHRVLDGVLGSNFLQSLKGYIENPSLMLLVGRYAAMSLPRNLKNTSPLPWLWDSTGLLQRRWYAAPSTPRRCMTTCIPSLLFHQESNKELPSSSGYLM